MEREPIDQPLLTGTKIVDMLIPLGKGQRGADCRRPPDRQDCSGLDTIINQKEKDVICIYCWIGGSNIAFQKVVQALQSNGAMEYTICVCASGGSSSAQQHIALIPRRYWASILCITERDVLVVFDDLIKHALDLPSDVSFCWLTPSGERPIPETSFPPHSNSMERAGRLKAKFGGGQ